MARKDRNPKTRGWYEKSGDPKGTERFWDGEKWGPQPRVKRGAEVAEPKQKRQRIDREAPAESDETAESAASKELELEQSSVWARIAARAVDMVLVFLPWSLIWSRAFETEEVLVDGVVNRTTNVSLGLLWASVGVVVLYEVVFLTWWGATPGKRMVGLTVIDRDTLEAPGFVKSLLRSTPFVLLSAVVMAPLLWLACVLAIVWDRYKRSVFDFSGRTFVVMDPERQGRLARPSRSRNEQ